MLIGCLLAVFVFDPRVTVRLAMPGAYRDLVNAGGVFCGLVLLVCWITLAPKELLFLGPLLVCAVFSAMVVTACIVPEGPLVSLLGSRFFRWLGGLAIALYLVHWPIFVWISPDHFHHLHKGLKLIGMRLVATFVVAVVAKKLFDVTHGRVDAMAEGRSRGQLAGLGRGGHGGGGRPAGGRVGHGLEGQRHGRRGRRTALDHRRRAGAHRRLLRRRPGLHPVHAADAYGQRTGKIKVVNGEASPTCGIDRDQIIQNAAGASVPIPQVCSTWDAAVVHSVATEKPDIAVVVTGISEVADHRDPSDPTFEGPLNPDYQFRLLPADAQGHRLVGLVGHHGDLAQPAQLPHRQRRGLRRHPGGGLQHASSPRWAARPPARSAWPTSTPGSPANGASAAEPTSAGFAPAAADHVVSDFLAAEIASVWKAAHGGSPTTSSSTSSTVFVKPTLGPPPPGVVVSPTQGGSGRQGRAGRTTTTRAAGSTGQVLTEPQRSDPDHPHHAEWLRHPFGGPRLVTSEPFGLGARAPERTQPHDRPGVDG